MFLLSFVCAWGHIEVLHSLFNCVLSGLGVSGYDIGVYWMFLMTWVCLGLRGMLRYCMVLLRVF